MTGKGFLEYAKAEAHQQAKVSSGTTSFMQTGADRIAGLQCIAFHSGPGQHAVLVDVLPILIHEHGMIEKEKPTWLHEGQLSRVQAALDRREDEAFRELAHEIRSVLGPSTLIAFVLDGGERPRAKLAKMSERERRRCEKAKRQKPLACGSKASDVLNIQAPRKPWMQSSGHTLWLQAPDEADILIGHLLSAACPAGSARTTPLPDHGRFNSAEIRNAITLLRAVPASHRTVITRDSDLSACNVGTDVGWFLFPDWYGKLERLTMRTDGAIAPPPAANPPAARSTPARAAPPAQIPATRPTGSAPTAGHPPRGPTAAAKYRDSRGGKVAELPSISGNTIVLYARGLDALPALGGDRERRIRTWSICGNDYVGNGVAGITYKVIASGLLDDILARAFAPVSLGPDLTAWLRRLSSDTMADTAWRGSGRRGRVRKLDQVVLSDEIPGALIESDRIGNCLQARAYVPFTSRHGAKSNLAFGDRPPHVVRQQANAPSGECAPAAKHPYAGRPASPHSPPVPITADLRRQSTIQPRRPNEAPRDSDKARQSGTAKVRPRGPGESVVDASKDYEPEPIDIDPASLQRHRDWKVKAEEEEAARKKNKAEWERQREQEQKEREENGDDEFELRDGGSAATKRAGLDTVYEAKMSHAEPISVAFRDFTATQLSPPPPKPVPTAPADAHSPARRNRHRSSAQERRAQQRRLTAAPAPVHPPRQTPTARLGTTRASSATPGAAASASSPAAPAHSKAAAASVTDGPAAEAATASSGAAAEPLTSPSTGLPPAAGATGRSATGAAASSTAGVPSPTLASPHQEAASAADPSRKREPEAPPTDVACVGPLVCMLWLSMQLSLGFVTAAYRALTVQRVERGEAGVKLVSKAALERNGISGEHGRLASYSEESSTGAGLKNDPLMKADLSAAGTAARAAKHPTPPKLPASTYRQAYLPLQTAIKAIPEAWILDDLFGLGAFILAAPEENANFALASVFANSHRAFTFSASTQSCLDVLTRAPDAASRFRSAMARALGTLIRDHPYDPRCAKAGEEADDDHKIPSGERKSSRASTEEKTKASAMAAYGMSQLPAPEKEAEEEITPATAAEAFKPEQRQEIRKAVAEMLNAVAREQPSVALPADSAATMEADFIELAFRLVCFVHRNIAMALNLSGCKKKQACVGMKLERLLSGPAPIAAEKFSKSLLYLALSLRRMQDMDESRILPFFDPDWINTSIVDLLRIAQPAQLPDFLRTLEIQATEAARQLLPILQHVDHKNAEILSVLRQLFELRRANGEIWDWSEAERAGSTCASNPTALADLLGVSVHVRSHHRSRTEAISPTLQTILGTKDPVAAYVEQKGARVEVLNIVARRAVQAQRFVPTGMMQFTAHHVRFFGVKIDSVKAEHLEAADGLDAGLFFSRIAQGAWSQLSLDDYFPTMQRAYEVGRTDGAWRTSVIDPLARPDEQAMNACRIIVAVQPRRGSLPLNKSYRLGVRLRRAVDRKAGRSQPPSQLRTAIRRAAAPDRTQGGLPHSWGSIRTQHTRERLDRFVVDCEPDKVGYGGFDLGVRNPVAAYLSSPSTTRGASNARSEGSIVYSQNRLLTLERRNSERMSHLNAHLARQLDTDRFANFPEDAEQPPPNEVVRATWTRILTKAHPVRERIQLRYGIERDAEISSFVSELGGAIAGNIKRDSAERREVKWVFFVGEDMTTSGQHGASSHNVIMRALPAELRRRNISAMFVRTPEDFTSQRCPNPRCRRREDPARRSRAETMVREDGSRELRLLRCVECGSVFNRDGAAASNMIGSGLSWWWHARGLWGAWIQEK